ncbi:MAG: hypothetical protein OER88_05105 [Planctomycetota bacterium]|nr:hypothetical protein [Planctomycetota bacterium]
MRRLLLALALFAAPGCGGAGLVLLGAAEADDLVENLEYTVEAQQLMTEFFFLTGRGDIDLDSFTNYTYDPPSAANGWTGTLDVTGGQFPFGNGDLNLTFTAIGDAGPADPYTVDLTDDSAVSVDGAFSFVGTSLLGRSLSGSGTFDAATLQNTVDDLTATLDGGFVIRHDGYQVDLTATDLDVVLDVAQGEITNVAGSLAGTVDIPDFAFDADVDITGVGDAFDVAIDAAATTINYTLALF